MATLHIVEGPVGAGKTTFARQLARRNGTPPLVLDDWMVTLFRPDRPAEGLWPWYAERKQRCVEQIWKLACGLLDLGNAAIVELGLVRSVERLSLYARAEAVGYDYCVHVLDAAPSERWRRVEQRNREQGETFSMEVSADVFRMASEMWEPLSSDECAGRNVQFVSSYGAGPE